MAVWDKSVFWSLLFLLADAQRPPPSIIYPFLKICAVKRSTVTLPCTFTPATSVKINGKDEKLKIVRVVWCKNHEICHGITPSVYDSNSANNNPRYEYLGDKKRNCTLQIRNIQKEDDATFRFRMETDHKPCAGCLTNSTGVRVSVVDGVQMRIQSSRNNNTFTRGESVSLQCTTLCTFHQLEVTWFKDGHALSESGPALHLSSMAAKDSGNYTCALKNNMKTQSLQHSLQVEPEEGSRGLILGVVFGLLLSLFTLGLFVFIIKRKWAAAASQRALGGEMKQKAPDYMLSGVQTEDHQHETGGAVEDANYASVEFTHREPGRKGGSAVDQREVNQKCPDSIYSSVITGNEQTESSDVSYASVEFKNQKKKRRREEDVGDAVVYAGVVSRG